MPLAPDFTGSAIDQPTRADSLPEPIAADAMPQPIGQVPPPPQMPPTWDDLQSALKDVGDEDKSHAVEAWRDNVSRYGYEKTAWLQSDEDNLQRFADDAQKKIASEVKFERGDKLYKQLANDFLTDPMRPGDALIQAYRDGVINRADDEQLKSAFEIQDQMRMQAEEQRLAGGNQKLKAVGVGAGRGLAFAAGAVGGAKVAAFGTALIPVVGETVVAPIVAGLVGGAIGGTITAAGYDELVRSNFESAMAASKLNPNYTAAGELGAFVIPGIAGVAKGIKRFALVAENLGRKEALNQAAKYVAVSGGIGAASTPVMSAIDRWKNSALDLGHEPQADLFDPGSIAANTVLAIMLGNLGVKFTKFNAGQAASIHQRGMAGQKLSPAEREMFDTINRKIVQNPDSFFLEAEQATFRNPKTGEQMPMSGAVAVRTQRNSAQPQQPAGAQQGALPPQQGAPPPTGARLLGAPPPQPGAAPRRFNSQQEFNDFMDAAHARGDVESGHSAWKTANLQGQARWFARWMMEKVNASGSRGRGEAREAGSGDSATWFANSVTNAKSNADHATFVVQQQSAASAKAAPKASAAAAGSASPPPVAGVPGGQQGRPGGVPSVPRGGAPVVAAEPAVPVEGAPKTTAALAGTVVPLPLPVTITATPLSPAPEPVTPAPAAVSADTAPPPAATVAGETTVPPVAATGATGQKMPWQMTRAELLENNLPEGEINNKTTPASQSNRPGIGAWRMDKDTGELEQLQEFNPHKLDIKEERVPVEDIRVYREWAERGLKAPPVTVVAAEGGKLQGSGRRRIMAARLAGKTIEGWRYKKVEGTHSAQTHKEAIQQALREGKPVPESVLADYPDIKPPAAPAPAAALVEQAASPKVIDVTESPNAKATGPRLAIKLDDGTIIHSADAGIHAILASRAGIDPARIVDTGFYGILSGEFKGGKTTTAPTRATMERPAAPAAPAPAPEGGVALKPEESAALRITLLKGVENRGDGIFFVPEKLMTPERRKELQRGGNAVQVKPWADVTGVPSDRGYAILDRRERIASRATKPTIIPEQKPSGAGAPLPEPTRTESNRAGLTKEESDALATKPSDTESDAVFNARERAKRKTKRAEETAKLAAFLKEKGIDADGLAPGDHITHVVGDREVRIERHTEGTMRAEIVQIKPGQTLREAIAEKFGDTAAPEPPVAAPAAKAGVVIDLTKDEALVGQGPRLAVKLDDGTILHAGDLRLHSQLVDAAGIDPSRVVEGGWYGKLSGEFRAGASDAVRAAEDARKAKPTPAAPAAKAGDGAPKLEIRDPSENVTDVMDANGMDAGAKIETANIDSLSGILDMKQPSEQARVEKLKEKMRGEDGYIARLIVDAKGNVVEGQHRLEALRQLGVKDVPVVRIFSADDFIPDVDLVKEILRENGVLRSDHRNQIVKNLGEILLDENNSVTELMQYDPPTPGLKKAWDAALKEIVRQKEKEGAAKPTPAAPAAPKPELVVSPTVGTPIVGVGGSVISELQISRATYGAEIYNSMRAKDGTPPTRAQWERAMAGEYPEIIESGGEILTKTWQTSKAAAESFNANEGRKSMTDEATQVITGAIEGSGVPSRITNADQAASARQDMLPPAQRTVGPSANLELMADVKREMQDNPYLMTELLNRLTADPRSKTSDREQAMLINYGNILRNQADALFESQKEAAKNGDKTLLRELAKEEEKLLERKKDFMQITVDSGSEAGKTLQARQIALAEDFTLLNRVVIEEIAKGAKLTREERAKIEKETSAHEKLTKAVAERDKAIAETAEQKYRANELEKLLSESGKKPAETVTKGRLPVDYAPKKPFGENVIAYADAKAAEALARIRAKIGGQLGSAPDPTILADAAIYGAAKLTKGSVKFTQWSLEMAAEVGNWIKPYAKELWEQSKVQVENMMSEAPRDIVAEREATLAGLKEATEANLPKSKLYGYARALAKQFIDEGMTKMGDIDAAVHAELQKVIPEITVRESGTAWTGYGEWKPASIEPASVTLANVTGERRAALKLEGVRDLDPPEARRNTGQGRQPPTAQTRMTEKEAARIEKQKNLKSVDPEKAHKTALESVKNNLRNRLEELKLAMATRKRINRDKIGVERDAEAKDLQDQLDVAQKDYDQVFPKEPITIDEQLRRSAVIAERNAAEWEKRTSDAKKGIFKTSEKSDAPINQRIQAANDQAAAYRAEATRLRDLDSSISEAKTQAKLDSAGERLGDILDNGEKTKPSAKQGPVTAATSAKQARNAALRKAIEDSRNLSGETGAKRAEAIGRALDKEIAKVSNELETNTRRAAATGKVDTVGNEQKRSELAAMRDFRKELDKVTGKTIDEKTLDLLIKRRDVLQREVDSGKIDPKTGRPTANTAEQAKIQGEINALNARKAQIRKAANPKTPENIRELQLIQDRLDSAKDRLARGQIEPETGKPTVRDKAQTDALAELKTINDTIAQMRREVAPSLSSAMKNLRAERARIIRSIADKTLRIYGQEFEPRARPVKPVPFTPQEKALAEANMADRVELNRIENRLHQAAFDHALKSRTLPQKTLGLLLELYQLTRVTALSYDFSIPLRQGKMIIFDRMWSKSGRKDIASAFAAMFKATGVTPTGLKAAFKSYQDYALAGNKKRGFVEASRTIAEYGERFETAVNLEISQRPDAPLYKAWGLDLTAWSDSSAKSKIQEGFESRWKRYIPGVGASGRAASAFTNRLMADAASARIALLAKDGMVTPRQGQIIMQEINISVGRATLGKPGGNLDRRSRATASGLAYLFLAPRFAISRFMALYGHSFWRAALTGEGRVAKIIAAQYARYIAGLAVNYTLISLMQDEDDPMIGMNPLDKSTFGIIQIGDTRYDPLSGLRQAAVISSQFIARKKIAGSGRKIDLTAEKKKNQFDDDLGDVLGAFFRSKLNIVPATAYDIWSGTDLSGKPVQALPSGTPFTEDFEPGELLTMPMPLSLEQTYEVLRAQRLDKGMVLSILGILGDSIPTYSNERSKSR